MMLITTDQLEIRLGVSFTDTQLIQAEQAIEMESAVIAAYCNLVSLVRVEDDEISLRGSYSYELALPMGPVVDVTSVTVDGFPAVDFDVVRDVLIRTDISPEQYVPFRHPQTPHWGGTDALVEIVYTHGFASVPVAAQNACLANAARSMGNPSGVRRTSIDNYEVDWGTDPGGGLSAGQMQALKRFHRSSRSANTG